MASETCLDSRYTPARSHGRRLHEFTVARQPRQPAEALAAKASLAGMPGTPAFWLRHIARRKPGDNQTATCYQGPMPPKILAIANQKGGPAKPTTPELWASRLTSMFGMSGNAHGFTREPRG